MISTCLQKRWATGPPLLSFCWYTDEIGDCLGSVWGQQVGVKVRSGGLWGQSRQKAASWETIPAFFKKEHPAPYNTHSGWSKPGAQREVLVWEDLRARKNSGVIFTIWASHSSKRLTADCIEHASREKSTRMGGMGDAEMPHLAGKSSQNKGQEMIHIWPLSNKQWATRRLLLDFI